MNTAGIFIIFLFILLIVSLGLYFLVSSIKKTPTPIPKPTPEPPKQETPKIEKPKEEIKQSEDVSYLDEPIDNDKCERRQIVDSDFDKKIYSIEDREILFF